MNSGKVGSGLAFCTIIMLSRREILIELRRLGVNQPSLLKTYLRDFEEYMKKNYGLDIIKKGGRKGRETKVARV